MNLITWPIHNPIPVILTFLLLSFAGVIGFQSLHKQDFPDLDLPTVNVTLRQPGAAPTQLETEVARKAEDAMATLQGLRHMTTTINDGVVSIAVEFQLERPLSDALADVKDAIDRIRGDLPRDVEEPQVTKVTVGPGGPILTYAISSARLSEEELSWFTDDIVARAILAVPGVGRFSRVGGVQREVQVLVDPVKLNALGVTAAAVSSALRNVQQDASGGRGQLGGQEQGVRTIATVKSAQDLAALPIALGDGRYVRLDQVATVTDTIAERSQAALLNGVPAVGFQVSRSKGYDETRIADGVEAALAGLIEKTPGLKAELIKSTVTQTEEQYEGSIEMLLEGALLSVLVVWWFLRDWRETLLGAVALPLSILPTFAVMYLFDYSLNTITLLALAVVVGILVDDAIVEVENIARHARMGKTVIQATEEAVREIALAVTATTATLIVVFLPTAFMPGVPGLVFKQFGWTVAAAVFASLLVARMVTPLMAVWLLRPKAETHNDGALMRRYMTLARWCLRNPLASVGAGVGFFAFSLALIPLLPTGFIPASDAGDLTVSIELPPGSNINSTLETAEDVRRAVADVAGVKGVFATVGEAQQSGGPAGSTPGEVRKGSVSLVLAERGTRPKQQVIEKEIRERLKSVPGARFSISGGGPGEKLQFVLSARDGTALKSAAQAVEADLRRLPYLSNINRCRARRRAGRHDTGDRRYDPHRDERRFRRCARQAQPRGPATRHPGARAGRVACRYWHDRRHAGARRRRTGHARQRCRHQHRERAVANRPL
jgi:multidrug efflux pump subunit AcrB